MNEIKPKKERRFLKTLGRVGEILVEQVLLKLGSSIIKKIGGKKTLPSILFIFLSLSLFAQFPNTGNKQRLGFQTTADGLTWRGSISDTASIQPINNQSAWVILDTINLKFYTFDFTSNVWNLVGGAQGLTMPFDSITFNTAKDGTVGVGEVEYNDTQGGLIQGLKGGNVTNVIGQQLHQRVNNRTGAPLAKGDVVYLAGSQGNRITVAKGLAVSDAFSANTFGVVAESIADNASGFIITEGLITGLNTSALTEDSAVYLSPTVAGALTSTKPQAPQHSVYIGVCVKSNNGSGELFVKIRNGQELDELHDTRITNPVTGATLYYSGGLWRDTTAALLVSDTASMLTPYFRDADTTSLNLTSRFAAKQNTLSNASASVSGILTSTDWNTFNNKQTAIAFAPPLQNQSNVVTISQASSTDNGYLSISDWNTFNNKLNLSDTASMLTNYLRSGVAASTYQTKLTNPITGTGNVNIIPKFTSTSEIGITNLFENGNRFVQNEGGDQSFGWDKMGNTSSPFFGNNVKAGSGYERIQRTASTTLFNPSAIIFGYQRINNSSGAVSYGGINFMTTSGNPSGDINPITFSRIFIEPDGNIGIGTMEPIYKFDIRGTLGVTGATTLSAPLTVNSSAVFNEGSADSDFRVESDGNANMVFVDASTDRVGIGYASPTKTLDVNGELRINTVTATPTSLLGKDGSNVVGNVTLGNSLTLSSGTLSVNNKITNINTSSYSILSTDYYIDNFNSSSTTIVLPSAALNLYRELKFKNSSTGALTANVDIIPLSGSGTTTTILSATNAKWCTIVSDGADWRIMQSN